MLERRYGAYRPRQVEEGARADEQSQADPYVQHIPGPGVQDVIAVPDVPEGKRKRRMLQHMSANMLLDIYFKCAVDTNTAFYNRCCMQ